MTSSAPILGAVLVLIVWRIYKRIRRNIGRQPLRPRRAMTSIAHSQRVQHCDRLSITASTAPAVGRRRGPVRWACCWVSSGCDSHAFETTAAGHFYIPNTPIGVTLSLLLVGRLAYRFMVLRDVALAPNHPPPMQSPLTFFIFGLTAGYYIVYQTGLFIHSRDHDVSGQKSFALGGSNLDSSRDRS